MWAVGFVTWNKSCDNDDIILVVSLTLKKICNAVTSCVSLVSRQHCWNLKFIQVQSTMHYSLSLCSHALYKSNIDVDTGIMEGLTMVQNIRRANNHCEWQNIPLYSLWSPYGIGQTIIFSCCGLFFFFFFFFMVALCNREAIYIFILFLSSSSFFFFFFSSPNLSGRRLDVYHTLAHGVALVRI